MHVEMVNGYVSRFLCCRNIVKSTVFIIADDLFNLLIAMLTTTNTIYGNKIKGSPSKTMRKSENSE